MWTRAYWALVAEKGIRAGAAGALAVLGTGHIAGYSVPWQGLLYGAGIGALTSILSSLSSSAVPGTLPTSFLPARLLSAPRKPAHELRAHGDVVARTINTDPEAPGKAP